MLGSLRHILSGALIVCSIAATAGAQDPRGSITGRITDSSGGRMPGATVTATNIETNVPSATTTNGEGDYSILYLTPGMYTLSVELSGFKKMSREGLQVRIGDRLAVDGALEVGRMEETVTVTAESPLLDTRSGSAGQVIDEKAISLMPLSDGNPFVLSRLVPGVAYNGDLKFSRPFDNGGTSAINADGATGGNEFTLDGSPNMANGRRVAFVPPAGAVSEFKVSTASFDAGEGHTAGASVNVTLKSGTNRIRGRSLRVLPARLALGDRLLRQEGRRGETEGHLRSPRLLARRPRGRSGPVQRPQPDVRVRRGRMALRRVPRARTADGALARRCGGGISRSCWRRTSRFTIRTPRSASARASSGRRFPGNIIPPGRISPIAQQLLKYFPLPNQAGNLGHQQLLFHQPADRRFLFDLDPRRSSPHRQAAGVRALHAEQPQGSTRRVLRRGERHRAGRQLPLPDQRRRDGRPRLHDQLEIRARHPRRLAALPGAERQAARRPDRPGGARVPAERRGASSAARSTFRASTSAASPRSATTSADRRRTASTRSSRRSPA